MSVILTVDTTAFNAALKNLTLTSRRAAEVTFKRSVSSFTRRLIGITPPAKGERGARGVLTKEDQGRGNAAIGRDLRALFIGHKLKGKRKERWPDVAGIHRAAFQFKRPGKPLKPALPGGQKYDVDQKKLSALVKELFSHVGRLASGWLEGALKTGATGTPSWVSRHGTSRGSAEITARGGEFGYVIINSDVPDIVLIELRRRVEYALAYETTAMVKDMDGQSKAIAAKFNRESLAA